MTTDESDRTLRFNAGTYEGSVLDAIILAQYLLLVFACFVAFGWLYFTVGFLVDPNASVYDLIGAIPVVIGMLVLAYLLTCLYE